MTDVKLNYYLKPFECVQTNKLYKNAIYKLCVYK